MSYPTSLHRWLLGIYFHLLTLALLLPVSAHTTPLFYGADKVMHFLSHALLAYLAQLPNLKLRWRLYAMITLLAYSVIIENIQPYFGRGFSSGDIIANAMGIAVGAVIANRLPPFAVYKKITQYLHHRQ